MDNDETFDEMSDEVVEAPEPDVSDAAKQAEYWRKRAEKAEKQAVERKVQLGRFETATKHGISAELIPDWVPLDKMDEFAERFAKTVDSPVPTQTETSEAEADPTELVVSEAERNLAAVAKGSVSTGSSQSTMTEDEIRALAKADPARYAALRASGSIPPPPRIGAEYHGR